MEDSMDITNRTEGGFVYRNNSRGVIENCYAAVRIGKRKRENAGFVYENKGTIFRCFTRSHTRRWKHSSEERKKQKDGFYTFNNGVISQSFFLTKKRRHLKCYRDGEMGLAAQQASCRFLEKRFGWDFTIFDGKMAIETDFLKENWYYLLIGESEKEHIDSEKKLLDIIDKINHGDQEAANGWYELDSDLDLHGSEIAPIGCDPEHSFNGVFDGNGHTIRGFVLNGKDRSRLGLFGYLNGTVANLCTDGIVRGKNCRITAAFCAVNKGEIHCCEAVSEIYAKQCVGMFVGENYGWIERCSVSGKSYNRFLLCSLPSLPILALLAVFAFNPILPPGDYNPVMTDATIVPNEDDEPIIGSNENTENYEVTKILKVDAGTLTASGGNYVIKNPDRGANYDFVAAIYMTDNRENPVEVYKSGRIPVGYYIEELTLTPPNEITLSEGSYNAEIIFSFYQQDSGEKEMADSRVPIIINIQ